MTKTPDRSVGAVLSIAEASGLRWAAAVLRDPHHPDRAEARDLLHRLLATDYNTTPMDTGRQTKGGRA